MLAGDSTDARPRMWPVLALLLVAALLYVAQDILIPLALAGLLCVLLTPAVAVLERCRLPRVPAVLLVAVLAFSTIVVVGSAVGTQVAEVVAKLPEYKGNIRRKAESLVQHTRGLQRTGQAVAELSQVGQEAVPPGVAKSKPPMKVEVVEPQASHLRLLGVLVAPLVDPLETALLVIIVTVFLLIERDQMRDRVLRLAGIDRIGFTTQALEEINNQVCRYLLLQFVNNTIYGLIMGLALYLAGLPHAVLWGALGMLFRFVPYLGPMVAGSLPVIFALAFAPDWTLPLLVIGIIGTLELISNNVIEVVLYSSGTGLSTLGIIMAAIFWTWMWGSVGLILSVPLTVCLVVTGRYVPQLRFLAVLLGDHPALPPEVCFYQRLLAHDLDAARTVANSWVEKQSLAELDELLLLPALCRAERDRRRGALPADRQAFVHQCILEFAAEAPLPATEPPASSHGPILCLPARCEADAVACSLFARRLQAAGIEALIPPRPPALGRRRRPRRPPPARRGLHLRRLRR